MDCFMGKVSKQRFPCILNFYQPQGWSRDGYFQLQHVTFNSPATTYYPNHHNQGGFGPCVRTHFMQLLASSQSPAPAVGLFFHKFVRAGVDEKPIAIKVAFLISIRVAGIVISKPSASGSWRKWGQDLQAGAQHLFTWPRAAARRASGRASRENKLYLAKQSVPLSAL